MRKSMIVIFLFALANLAHAQPVRHTRNVVLVVIDGYRWKELFRGADPDMLTDTKYVPYPALTTKAFGGTDARERREKLMPFVWSEVAKHGRLYGNRDLGSNVDMHNPYWVSFPGRAEMFTGKVNLKVDRNDYGIDTDPNVFNFLAEQPGLHGNVAGFASWQPVGDVYDHRHSAAMINVLPEDIQGPGLSSNESAANEWQHLLPEPFGPDERLDAATFALAKSYMQARHPRLLYLDVGNADEYGHDGRYDSYLEAIHHTDAMIASLWQIVQSDPFYRNTTTLLIVPDHGRGDGAQWRSHGTKYAHSGETWLMVMGPDTLNGGEMKNTAPITEDQLATTLARFLGREFRTVVPDAAAPIDGLMKSSVRSKPEAN